MLPSPYLTPPEPVATPLRPLQPGDRVVLSLRQVWNPSWSFLTVPGVTGVLKESGEFFVELVLDGGSTTVRAPVSCVRLE